MSVKKCLSIFIVTSLFIVVFLIFTGCTPYIRAFSPEEGNNGTVVTINGKRFGATTAENTVKFANTAVPVSLFVSSSTTQLKVKVPDGATTGLITVQTSRGVGHSQKNFVVEGRTKWTLMVYLDADNNLESAGIDDFLEMASIGSGKEVKVVVMMDRLPGYSTEYGDWTGARRFLITKGSTPQTTPVMDMGELNMGNPAVLQDFVEWAVTKYPAEHYALSIWNHGDGWRKSQEKMDSIVRASKSPELETLVKAVASDDTDGDILYMREVQNALNGARTNLDARGYSNVKLDVVGFDACLMGMVEVAYAIREDANYMVGSEELEPGDGWPYDKILTDLTNNPNMTPENLASDIVKKYGAGYPGSSVTLAAYDISKLETLAQKIDNFTVKANTDWAGLKTARLNSRQYHPSWSSSCWGTDLWDFADRAYNSCSSTEIKDAALQLKNAINSFVIQEFHNSSLSGSHGVAIYFPPDLVSFTNDPQHTGYQQTNLFMPVDFVIYHQFDNWLPKFYDNIN